ncbi:hypothetical protein PanWU01x14_084040 [Parasponia andersonii]|uniref:Aspartic peptidase domain containing protein n=1 Tax=Parasponia andersonii TaxID=3476 RepID=A0A2P5D9H3_PARAD|nr:hypothetical protein PanWU01x14_084040 [Parasponia andersonii]
MHLEQRSRKLQRVPDMDITFTEQDAREVHSPHNDALVIKINCGSTQLWRVLVDNGSAVDILYFDAFKKMGLNESDLKSTVTPLYGFTGDSLMPMGMIKLMVSVGTYPRVSMIMTQILVVDCPSAFNAMLGRPTLRELRAVTSIYHLTMKFPTQHGVGERKRQSRQRAKHQSRQQAKRQSIRQTKRQSSRQTKRQSSRQINYQSRHQTASIEPSVKASIETTSEDFDPQEIDEEVRTGPIEDLEDLSFDISSKTLMIGTEIQEPMRASLVIFLKSNLRD